MVKMFGAATVFCALCGHKFHQQPSYFEADTGYGLSLELYEFTCPECHRDTMVSPYDVKLEGGSNV